ncbi:MAG: flagellar basal body L-ring protein FlgH [Halanaerobiales bacterium]|nr:flagellar basal body L-ring protein FlgH [Halanaerobiales bacterium]
MYRIIGCLLSCLLFFAIPVPASANSLWIDDAADVYKNHVALDIGDLVMIIISEKSTASQQASTETSQDTSLAAGPGLGIFSFVENFSLSYDDKNGADGSTSRQGTLTAVITAQVVGKQPNGNLMVRGYKMININEEKQEIEIFGVIRPDDVQADNTIESRYMTDVEINFTGQGVVGDKQKAGLFEKIFNWLF